MGRGLVWRKVKAQTTHPSLNRKSFEIDSVDFMATDQAYFQIAAQLTLAIRPAFRRAVEQLRKIIPKMIREQLDKSRVIQDLKRKKVNLSQL